MGPIYAATIAAALVAATIVVHYEILRVASIRIPAMAIPPRSRILVVLAMAFLAHLAEICLYAIGFYLLAEQLGLGSLGGSLLGNGVDYFYFSVSSYTSLGLGDIYPQGPIRLVAGIEALNGLILIAWTASFTYLSMQRFWEMHPHRT